MSNNFQDFTPEQLIGKTVLFEYGEESISRYICTIAGATKTQFEIKQQQKENKWIEGMKFSTQNGKQKGRSSFGPTSSCKILTTEEAVELSRKWAIKRRIKELKAEIVKNLDQDLSIEQLEAILHVINKAKS